MIGCDAVSLARQLRRYSKHWWRRRETVRLLDDCAAELEYQELRAKLLKEEVQLLHQKLEGKNK